MTITGFQILAVKPTLLVGGDELDALGRMEAQKRSGRNFRFYSCSILKGGEPVLRPRSCIWRDDVGSRCQRLKICDNNRKLSATAGTREKSNPRGQCIEN